jgi:leader peptidase (prepilin peptidase)/N-methyltransferase
MWGSFLNVVACRLIKSQSIIYPRSHCPNCKHIIAWYDNIPVLSWLLLRAKCRFCKKPISILYPFVELLTAGSLTLLYIHQPEYFMGYALFFSALLVIVRTDLQYMLISRLSSIGMIPFAWILSYFNILPLTLSASLLGTVVGYLTLWLVAYLFYALTKKHGLGEGDFDLLALIGSFCGIEGVFISILIGSWVGTIISLAYIAISGKNIHIKVPFGPFLAFGAMSYVIWHDVIEQFLITLSY